MNPSLHVPCPEQLLCSAQSLMVHLQGETLDVYSHLPLQCLEAKLFGKYTRLGVRKLKASHKSIQQMKAAANMKQTPSKVNSAKSRWDWARRPECVMILSIIGHSRTAVKTCPFKELWPNNLLRSHKSAYAGSKDRTTVKCDNTQDAGTSKEEHELPEERVWRR